jgi:hypothetical protein
LSLPGYHLQASGKLVIESKADIQARGEVSPDDADAFVLTFAAPVAPQAAGAGSSVARITYRPRSRTGMG